MTTTSKIVRTLAWLCPLVLALAAGASAARAQEKFPDHPINFIVPWGPGGGADLLARRREFLAVRRRAAVAIPGEHR